MTNFIDSDSDPENSILKIKKVDNIGYSIKSLEIILAATEKTNCLRAKVSAKGALFSATNDTGSPASFVNKMTADILLSKESRATTIVQERPITTSYVDYNHRYFNYSENY